MGTSILPTILIVHCVLQRQENTIIMSAMDILSPVMDLVHNAFVQEKVEEVAKLFFTSDSITINLLPGLIAGGLLLLLLIPLLASFSSQPQLLLKEDMEDIVHLRSLMEPLNLHMGPQNIDLVTVMPVGKISSPFSQIFCQPRTAELNIP